MQIPAYASAPEQSVTGFVDALTRLWQRKQLAAPAPHHGPLLDAAQRWAAYRDRAHRSGGSTAPKGTTLKTAEPSAPLR